jgi:hypothetical protein
MRPDITEFSYGYALTSNLMDCYSLQGEGAPEFPNLYQEGTSKGFDVKLPGVAVFLQFKLSQYMVRSWATAAPKLGVPHFRFDLMSLKHSKQHTLLLNLEKAGNEVYYCAPGFHLPVELSVAFSNAQVPDRTAYFRPSDIGQLPDNKEHSISFTLGQNTAWFYSDPREIRFVSVESIFGPNARRPRGYKMRTGSRDHVFRDLGDDLLTVFESTVTLNIDTRRQIDALRGAQAISPTRYLGFISETLFGCYPMFVRVSAGQN